VIVHARYVNGVTIRRLHDGDMTTVSALFDRLGVQSRAKRFGVPKPRLSEEELVALARADRKHHVLVGFLEGDPNPAAIARLVQDGDSAEVAVEVADVYQGRGIGTILAGELAADARAAGIKELRATVCGDNPRAVALLKSFASKLRVTFDGTDRTFSVQL
jgi:acetyltransferase